MTKKDIQELRNWAPKWIKIPPHCDKCALPKDAQLTVYTFLNNFEEKRFPVICRCKFPKRNKGRMFLCKHGKAFFINKI